MRPLVFLLAAPLFVHAQTGVFAPWDISATIGSLSEQATRLKPVLDQFAPEDWVKKGAPEAYVSQWKSAESQLDSVGDASAAFQKQPEKLSNALNLYFQLQALDLKLGSLVEGVRNYQNPSMGDLLVEVMAENFGNRDKLQHYISDLAVQQEQEFSVADKEAQRCRVLLNRQPAPAKPPAPKAKKPATK